MVEKITHKQDLPEIPSKRYFGIGEAAELCCLKSHVLRYWEQVFPQLSPNKRRGNRRYYTQDDILLIREIRELLYLKGFTISGAKLALSKDKKSSSKATAVETKSSLNYQQLIDELNSVLAFLD